MKLLAVIPEFPPHIGGGIGSFYRELLPNIAAQGHGVRLLVGSALSEEFCPHRTANLSVEALEPTRVSTFEKQFAGYAMFPLLRRHLAAAWAAWEQAEQGVGFDAVETTDWGMLFVPWVVKSRLPVRVQLHGSIGQIGMQEPQLNTSGEMKLSRLIEVNCLWAARQLQTYSRSNKHDWEALLARPVERILPPIASFSAVAKYQKRELTGVVVGRVQSWKGPDLLCQAMRLLGTQAPPVSWIGRDTPGRLGTSLSRELALEFPDVWGKTIIPLGQRSPEEIRALIDKTSFGIVPSNWDVFNLGAAEMMSAGLIVLCSDGAGAAELINDASNGFVFQHSNAEALADCIRRVRDLTPSQRERIGAAARETVKARLDPSAIAEEHIASFEHLLGQSRGRDAEVDAWTAEAVSPQPTSPPRLTFLDQLPLRKLTAYVAQRAASKLSRRK